MVLGRLFVWAAAIAGGLLVLAIGFLIGEQFNKPQASSTEDQDATTAAISPVSTLDLGDTYHPTEALVTQLEPEEGYERATLFTGELVSQHRSSLAFEVNGLVSEVLVDKGYSVKQNDIIASIDPANLKLRYKQAQAERSRAAAVLAEMKAGPRKTTLQAAKAEVEAIKAELVNLSKQLKRQRQLAKDGVISDSELDAIQSATTAAEKRQQAAQRRLDELESGTRAEQIEAQQATLEALQAQLELLELQLEDTKLRAPFDGVILDTFVDQGAVVAAGQQVAQLVDDQHLEAHVGVPAPIAAQITQAAQNDPNATYTLRIGETGLESEFDRVLPVVDPVTQTALVVFRIDTELPDSVAENTRRESQELSNNESTATPDTAAIPVVAYPGAPVQLRWQQQVATKGYWVPNQALSQARRGLWSLYQFTPDKSNQASGSERKESERNETGLDESKIDAIPTIDSAEPPITGRVTKLQVEVLYAQRNRSFVRGTLTDQPWIIIKGAHRLLDGQRVQVKQDEAEQTSAVLNAKQMTEPTVPSNEQ